MKKYILVGYNKFTSKKTGEEGKILHVIVKDDNNKYCIGAQCNDYFVIGNVAEKISLDWVDKEVKFLFDEGYQGKVFIADINLVK